MGKVCIERVTEVSLFQKMEELQLRIWGYSDRDVVPSQMFVVAQKSGGEVLGAFLDDELIGFTLEYAGLRDGKSYLHSHMAGVVPEYRDRGLGRDLKLAQRANALARGISRIEWTFDPLQTKNAYFNICRLGVVVRSYSRNVYGCTSSPLHAGLPTDRLRAEWVLDSPRVVEILGGNRPAIAADRELRKISVENSAEPKALQQSQAKTRERFEALFSEGYCVTWFERDRQDAAYILEPSIGAE